ncbi:MAG: hypothetical protein KJ630_06145 [Proteobacteria bacterium]|nr:hypothetical protein [Pseudomonadota bacterium]
MKPARTYHDVLISFTLTAVLHLLVIKTAVLPPGNYFFPFVAKSDEKVEQQLGSWGAGRDPGDDQIVAASLPAKQVARLNDNGAEAIPYQHAARYKTMSSGLFQTGSALSPLVPLWVSEKVGYRSLVRQTAVSKLTPPLFSGSTIPPRPEKTMVQEVDEDTEAVLLGNVFNDALPATSGYAGMLQAEAAFLKAVQADIADGHLDMPFSTFIISAEYFHLSRAMMPLGQQPSFTLEEAMARYDLRLQRVGENLPKEIDGYSLVMMLQRYAENKFYPGNGSGMLLDSLFHNQNDCEGGTKEVLAYLQALYPVLRLGSNRGMLQTTTGELIGHMQVFVGPGPESRRIIENDRGLIVETTRVSLESVQPYGSGEVFPLEDFVIRYYPEIVAGTPLADAVSQSPELGAEQAGRIVGTSDHPLKMSYGASTTLLAEQFYDLANIRTQRIENEFLRSNIPSCNPRIDPTKIDRTNLFSNFVAIDRKLRRSLIGHYLADLQYWDNQVMPQWREPAFLANYEDLVGSLLDENSDSSGYIQVDAENSVPSRSLHSHGRFLKALKDVAEQSKDRHTGTGRKECAGRVVLDDRLLGFLFKAPEGPGVFFLPEPDENLHWNDFLGAVLNDCLAVPAMDGERSLLAALEEEVAGQQTSFRKELYNRVRLRGMAPLAMEDRLAATAAALTQVVSGTEENTGALSILSDRQSSDSSAEEPSVRETLAELGRTGINSGLVWDITDFLGPVKAGGLFLQYGRRADLYLTIPRAQELAAQLAVTLGGAGVTDFFAELLQVTTDPNLQLAAAMNLARLRGLSATAISRLALDYLQGSKVFRAENLLALLQYGLLPEDALVFMRTRVSSLLVRVLEFGPEQGSADKQLEVFVELTELVRALQKIPDIGIWQALHDGLSGSLLNDFSHKSTSGSGGVKTVPDYGLLFNKLVVLALLHEQGGAEQGAERLSTLWLQQFIRFAAENPIGKLMLALVKKTAGDEAWAAALSSLIPSQVAILDRLRLPEPQSRLATDGGGKLTENLSELKAVLGDGNVIARMLLLADVTEVRKLSGLPVEQLVGKGKNKAAWYLEKLHRRIAPIVGAARNALLPVGNSVSRQPQTTVVADPVGDFYNDDRVRESFAMLGYFQEGGDGDGNGVKFMKTQDLAAIKDASKLRVVEGERKITRQDMSLLTLALNTGNHPSAIRRALEETLIVTGKHLGLNHLDQGLRQYLFAPHFPYLTENDSGFFFSPETVEDLHNAAEWGGRNDILLSSYLHFRNLPGQLPDWLRRTAIARSELELKIIKKFEQQSFLPMILECDSDKSELPDSLFRAKWAIRKPFGEDIFPGTLLLLRLGYLEITAAGEIVRTAKYFGG